MRLADGLPCVPVGGVDGASSTVVFVGTADGKYVGVLIGMGARVGEADGEPLVLLVDDTALGRRVGRIVGLPSGELDGASDVLGLSTLVVPRDGAAVGDSAGFGASGTPITSMADI